MADQPAKEPPYQPPAGSTREFQLDQLSYRATSEWLLLRKKEKPVAEVFHVFYQVLDSDAPRPVTFVFNGGPGASSAYLHVGALGPKRVAFEADGSLKPPPAQIVDNHESWLAFTDLVFVDPIGTGFSRVLDKPEKTEKPKEAEPAKDDDKEFYQLNRDLESLCEFISKFLSKHRLWSRPVYIAGESYGGFRVAKLARKLQESYGVGLCGAIMISPALELTLLDGSDYSILSWTDAFPSLALAAAHHGKSRIQSDHLRREAENFATREMMILLTRGEALEHAEKDPIYQRMGDFLGLDPHWLKLRGGRVTITAFARELLRCERKVCGLYDASATSLDPFPDREEFHGADPTLFSIERVFTSGVNIQLREVLELETERDYRLLSMDVNRAWKIDDGRHAFESQVGATDDLRYGMCLNPHMKVFICHGTYDLVTPYFASERITYLLKLHPDQRPNLSCQQYHGGHMFYTWEASRQRFRDDIQAFYGSSK